MTLALLACAGTAWATVPQRGAPLSDAVDVIELSHFYDLEGRKVFDQVIFWGWYDDCGMLHVVSWRLWKMPEQTPYFDHHARCWRTLWQDGPTLREVVALSYRESWEQTDPEADDRPLLPPAYRRGLTGEALVMPPMGGAP